MRVRFIHNVCILSAVSGAYCASGTSHQSMVRAEVPKTSRKQGLTPGVKPSQELREAVAREEDLTDLSGAAHFFGKNR